MKDFKEIIYTTLNTTLGSVEVDGASIPYFADYFGEQDAGIYIESCTIEDASDKHNFGCVATVELITFSKNITTTTHITREVLELLRASVNSTLQLSEEGLQATYTEVPILSTTSNQVAGVTEHRDNIRLVIRIDVEQ